MIQTSCGVWMKYTGSATNSNWPGPPPGQQRDCALKARWPLRTRSLCILICAAAHGFRLRLSASDRRSTPRPGEYVGSAPVGATFPSTGWKSRKVVICHPKLAAPKFGMVPSEVPPPSATATATDAISAAPLSKGILNIVCSSVVAIRGLDFSAVLALLIRERAFISHVTGRANVAFSWVRSDDGMSALPGAVEKIMDFSVGR